MARGIGIAGDIRLKTRNMSRFEGLEIEEISERGGQKRESDAVNSLAGGWHMLLPRVTSTITDYS